MLLNRRLAYEKDLTERKGAMLSSDMLEMESFLQFFGLDFVCRHGRCFYIDLKRQ